MLAHFIGYWVIGMPVVYGFVFRWDGARAESGSA
jgi:hypothetical protein